MAETKKLVLVVERTTALEPYWPTILSDYLKKIISSFCGDKHTEPATPIAEMTLVTFNARDREYYSSSSLVERTGWTKNMNTFLEWLSSIKFNGDGFSNAAIAEGLAEALTMFPSVNVSQNHQRHCILIAASNPYPLPTQVYIPPTYIGANSNGPLSDAETVAKYFKQCLVSLSVICPRQLPKLEAIFHAGQKNPSISPDISIWINPNDVVLISESFKEARAGLSETYLPLRTDTDPVSGPPPISDLPVTELKKPSLGVAASLNNIAHLVGVNPGIANVITEGMTSYPSVAQSVTSPGQGESTTSPGTSTSTGPTMPTNVVSDNMSTNVDRFQQILAEFHAEQHQQWQ